jgi:uncharacterized protein YukE
MATTIAKRIQSRLSRQGIKVSLGDIRPVFYDIVVDADNPTDEEVDAIFQHFMDASTQLAVVEEEPAPVVATEEVEELNTLDNLDGIDTLDNQGEPQEEPAPSAIATCETSELVASTAESMGIALNLEDVTAIAQNFDYASTNSDDELEEIKSAITAFVQHKAALSRQKIKHIVQEVKQTIHNLDAENSELLNDGLRSISQDIKSGSERFRQQTRQALKVFELPPAKAG